MYPIPACMEVATHTRSKLYMTYGKSILNWCKNNPSLDIDTYKVCTYSGAHISWDKADFST